MKTSEKGIALIKEFEGLYLQAYLCPANIWTIGYGHTIDVNPDDTITFDKADELLIEDISCAEQIVDNYVNAKLLQHQFDALVSFVFNIGAEKFKKSTLLRNVNLGDYNKAAGEFTRWVRANNKIIPGLLRRRKAEMGMFLNK